MEHVTFSELALSACLASKILYLNRGQAFMFAKIFSVTNHNEVVVVECGRVVRVGQTVNEAISTNNRSMFRVPNDCKVCRQHSEKIFYFSFEPWRNQGEYRAAVAALIDKEIVRSIFLAR